MRLPGPALTFLALTLSALPAFAAPGEADAVLLHCGQPTADNRTTSPISNNLQRDLVYNNLTLHFEPIAAGWSFTTAWRNHLPITRGELEGRMPCFRDAMQDAATAPQPVIDPTIVQETAVQPANPYTFGIPYFWLIVALAISLLIFILWPPKRAPTVNRVPERTFRQPDLRVDPPGYRHTDPDV